MSNFFHAKVFFAAFMSLQKLQFGFVFFGAKKLEQKLLVKCW